MKSLDRITITSITAVLALALGGCGGMSRQEEGMVVGAGAGAIAGSVLTGGSTVGTVGGAAVGGLIGNEIGKR
jgi:osmotically inducible lipoprotein OsmB